MNTAAQPPYLHLLLNDILVYGYFKLLQSIQFFKE